MERADEKMNEYFEEKEIEREKEEKKRLQSQERQPPEPVAAEGAESVPLHRAEPTGPNEDEEMAMSEPETAQGSKAGRRQAGDEGKAKRKKTTREKRSSSEIREEKEAKARKQVKIDADEGWMKVEKVTLRKE